MKKTNKFQGKKVESLPNTKVVIIKEQPVKGGGIGCSDKNETTNTVYEF